VTPLHAEISGRGPLLVLAHGFTQTARSWGEFGRRLADRHRLLTPDLPGHGASSTLRADLPEAGALVAATAAAATSEEEPSFDLLGYSLGARVALHTALERPPGLRRLILIGGTAGIEDPSARRTRRQRDDAMADELQTSGDLDGFLSRWLAMPMFAGLADPGLAERRRNTPEGLASSLRMTGTGTQEPLWDRLGELACPVLAIAGAADARFCAYGVRLAAGVGARQGVFSVVPGASHAAHLAQPALCAQIVHHFLA